MGSKGEATKQRILEASAVLFQRQGYHGTGLKEILEESGAPRGSFYFHFPGGKEELAQRALEISGEALGGKMRAIFRAQEDFVEGGRAVVRALSQVLEGSDFVLGCPVASVALDVSSTSEALRVSCGGVYARWKDVLEEELVSRGLEEVVAKNKAMLFLSSVEGALLLSKAMRSVEPLENLANSLDALLR